VASGDRRTKSANREFVRRAPGDLMNVYNLARRLCDMLGG
jgi:hypothetical protein